MARLGICACVYVILRVGMSHKRMSMRSCDTYVQTLMRRGRGGRVGVHA